MGGTDESALQGIRVLDFTWVLAGPYGTRILADFGAEVIKIQTSQTARGMTNVQSGYYNTYNRNKLGIALNMGRPEGVTFAKKLVQISDIVVDNFSSRVMLNWGLDYASLVKVNPDIIVVRMAGMGQTGPWKDYVSFGPTLHALSGFTSLSTFPGKPPIGFGYSYSDHIAGITAALAMLEAIEYRRRTGKGQFIDVSQFEANCVLLGSAILDHSVNGRLAAPIGNRLAHPLAAPHGVYRCKGWERWCTVAVFNYEEWKALCQVMGNPKWTEEPQFGTLAQRAANADELDKLLEAWTVDHSPEEVMEQLQQVGVAAGMVQNAQDLIERDPQLHARGFYVEARHAEMGMTKFDGTPVKLSRTPAKFCRAAPLVDQDNEYVYGELLGMMRAQVAKYIEEGILA